MKTAFKNFEISSKITANGVRFPFDSKSTFEHNKHRVSVKNTETNARIGFDFFGSVVDYKNGVVELPESDLLHAFESILSDAISAEDSFESFCGELGYDTDSRSAYRIYNECKKQLAKLGKINISSDTAYDLINELSELV